METKKIALACLIGGSICSIVALLFAPAYWWLGILAGFAGGYVSYEFRQVLQSIPKAVSTAVEVVDDGFNEILVGIGVWFAKPHPFIYGGLLITFVFFTWLFTSYPNTRPPIELNPLLWDPVATCAAVIGSLIAILLCTIVGVGIILEFVLLSTIMDPNGQENFRKINEMGYWDVFSLSLRGVLHLVCFLTFWAWVQIGWAIESVMRFGYTFAWNLFKLVHSEKRLLCGVDSAIGGTVSFFLFQSSSMPIITVIFGGLIGAALGIVNWEIVSLRVLHVNPNET